MLMQSLDLEGLRRQFMTATPYPFAKIDDFLDPAFAAEIAASYPSFEDALTQGKSFKTVNEWRKVQISDASRFPGPVARLNELLASARFLSDLSYVTGIPDLIADPALVGGGMHMTGPGGRLDVHIDFNYLEKRKLHRRLNLLLYLNPAWDRSWGGLLQLWDGDVKECRRAFAPVANRCVIFETSEISFHGVTPVTPAAPYPRISFANYYYTSEAPPHWKVNTHSTIFKARPKERLRKYLLMPAESMQRHISRGAHRLKRSVKKLIGVAR
jgi:hypothetical protein